jgi:hypothetical protein
VAAVLVLGLFGAACGGDDDDAATTDTPRDDTATDSPIAADGASADSAPFCDAALAVETAPDPELQGDGPPEDEAPVIMAWAEDVMVPLADDVEAAAPAEVEDAVATLVGAVDRLAADGDFAVFDEPDVAAADDELHAYELDTCGWTEQPVTAVDFAFEDLPAELPAGTTSFELTNDGPEVHQLLVVRRNEGTTQPVEELLALPEEEVGALITDVADAGPVVAGDTAYDIAELTPGDYLAVCFIPTGMTAFDGPPPEGAPHAMNGMVAEFSVS